MNTKTEEKTVDRIHSALISLMKKKDYENITVSDIIQEGKVSRSTFYAHFKNKDDVLDQLSGHIFSHVFSSGLTKEKGHDFSSQDVFDYSHLISHIFYHFKEDKELIGCIFLSSASHRFEKNLEPEIRKLVLKLVQTRMLYEEEVPEEILVQQYTSGLIGLLKYYTIEERKESPEEMCSYFFSLYKGKNNYD